MQDGVSLGPNSATRLAFCSRLRSKARKSWQKVARVRDKEGYRPKTRCKLIWLSYLL